MFFQYFFRIRNEMMLLMCFIVFLCVFTAPLTKHKIHVHKIRICIEIRTGQHNILNIDIIHS